jgi:hypothetical protein
MPTPTNLLRHLGEALLAGAGPTPETGAALSATPKVAEALWQSWHAKASERLLLPEIRALAAADVKDLDQGVQQVVAAIARGRHLTQVQPLRAYLSQVPAAIRRRLRRPADPTGRTLPDWLSLEKSSDLLALLPPRAPHFAAGDRPAEVGGLALLEFWDFSVKS